MAISSEGRPLGRTFTPDERLSLSSDQVIDSGTLFRRHASFVANFLARLGVGKSELDDVVQDVFMIAHRKGGYQPGPARPTTWLASIAMRVNANRKRSQRRARVDAGMDPMDPIDRAVASTPNPSDLAESRDALAQVQRALDSLDENMRSVFVLFELAGEPCDAIAAALDVPVGTVYSRLHTARKQFAKAHRRLVAIGRPAVGQEARVSP